MAGIPFQLPRSIDAIRISASIVSTVGRSHWQPSANAAQGPTERRCIAWRQPSSAAADPSVPGPARERRQA